MTSAVAGVKVPTRVPVSEFAGTEFDFNGPALGVRGVRLEPAISCQGVARSRQSSMELHQETTRELRPPDGDRPRMTPGSLQVRLLIGAAFSIAAALSLLFFAISFMFERHVERRVTSELQQFALQLAGTADIAEDGTLVFEKDITDVRFQRPLSGLYWQIEVDGACTRRSASLWDQALPELDDDDPPGEFSVHWYDLADLGALQAICRSVRLNSGAVSRRLAIQVAIDRKEVANLVSEFRADSGLAMLLLGFALLAGAAFQVLIGLRPLGELRDRLSGILTGNAKRLEGDLSARSAATGRRTQRPAEQPGALDRQGPRARRRPCAWTENAIDSAVWAVPQATRGRQ